MTQKVALIAGDHLSPASLVHMKQHGHTALDAHE
jgi:hypothetical protein